MSGHEEKEPQWRTWPEGECVHCGAGLEVLTEAPEGQACDGDPVRCSDCACPGEIVVDEDLGDGSDGSEDVLGVARAMQHDDAECECEWCLAHQVGLDGRCSGCANKGAAKGEGSP